MELKYESICCLCLTEDAKLNGLLNEYSKKLKKLTGVKFKKADIKSATACNKCLSMLDTYWNFQKKASEAFRYFVEMQRNTENATNKNHQYAVDTVILQECKIEIKTELIDEELDPIYEEKVSQDTSTVIEPNEISNLNEVNVILPAKSTRQPKNMVKLEKAATEKPKRKRHKRIYERVECVHCSKSLVSKFALRSHLLTHSKERLRAFQCHECEETFITKTHMKVHLSKHFNNFPFYCSCGKGFHLSVAKEKHEQQHKTGRAFKCTICSRKLTSKQRLEDHIKIIHDKTNVNMLYTCDVCGKNFATYHLFRGHRSTHAEKRYSCDVCSKSFRNLCDLKEHIHIHGEATFECDVCQVKFKTKALVRKHKRIHATERPFKCTFPACSRSYVVNGDLTSHMRTHLKLQV